MDIDIDDIACEIGDEVRCLVHTMIENALYDADLDEDEKAAIADSIWDQWKDWV